MNVPQHLAILPCSHGQGLFVRTSVRRGTPLFTFEGVVRAQQDADEKSLQIGEDQFLESSEVFDNFLNHSCEPNCAIDWDTRALTALRDIDAGEELTYDYCTSEWDYDVYPELTFQCECNSTRCRGTMRGLKHLPVSEQHRLLPRLSPFLQQKVLELTPLATHPAHQTRRTV